MIRRPSFFFFNDTATTEIYTLSLHDALPISGLVRDRCGRQIAWHRACGTTLRLPKKQKRPGEEGHRHAFRLGRLRELLVHDADVMRAGRKRHTRARRLWQPPNLSYPAVLARDRKSTRLNSSHGYISYAVFCL